MRHDGTRGIRNIPITGILFIAPIPIGAATNKAIAMAGTFMIGTIGATVRDGIRDSIRVPMVNGLQNPVPALSTRNGVRTLALAPAMID
jgi:hypothetical protein